MTSSQRPEAIPEAMRLGARLAIRPLAGPEHTVRIVARWSCAPQKKKSYRHGLSGTGLEAFWLRIVGNAANQREHGTLRMHADADIQCSYLAPARTRRSAALSSDRPPPSADRMSWLRKYHILYAAGSPRTGGSCACQERIGRRVRRGCGAGRTYDHLYSIFIES